MSESDIARAWKDERFRASLSEEQQAQVPENPAGDVEELEDAQIQEVDGGNSNPALTAGCCQASVNVNTCQLGWCIGSVLAGATIVCLSAQSC